jgi:hypothetical protein
MWSSLEHQHEIEKKCVSDEWWESFFQFPGFQFQLHRGRKTIFNLRWKRYFWLSESELREKTILSRFPLLIAHNFYAVFENSFENIPQKPLQMKTIQWFILHLLLLPSLPLLWYLRRIFFSLSLCLGIRRVHIIKMLSSARPSGRSNLICFFRGFCHKQGKWNDESQVGLGWRKRNFKILLIDRICWTVNS